MYHAWFSPTQADIRLRCKDLNYREVNSTSIRHSKHASIWNRYTGVIYWRNSKENKNRIPVTMVQKNPQLDKITKEAFPDIIYQGLVDSFESIV